MDSLQLAIDVIVGGGVGVTVVFVLRKYIEARLIHEFAIRLEQLKHDYAQDIESIKANNSHRLEVLKTELAVTQVISEKTIESRIAIYQEIAESVYRLRNILRDIRDCATQNSERPQVEALIRTFVERVNILKEQVFKSRIVLSEIAFDHLHQFKTMAIESATKLSSLVGAPLADINKDVIHFIDFDQLDAAYGAVCSQITLEINVHHGKRITQEN